MLKWYVLYTKVHAERQVAAHLNHHGWEVFLPMIPVARPRSDRPLERPYLPCYLFVHYDLEEFGESKIIYTPGLRRIIAFGGAPVAVPEQDVAHIREKLATHTIWDPSGVPLREGDPVEILEEPFRDVDAVFDRRLTPVARVRVFLKYLERHELERKNVERRIPLELDASLVRKKDLRK